MGSHFVLGMGSHIVLNNGSHFVLNKLVTLCWVWGVTSC